MFSMELTDAQQRIMKKELNLLKEEINELYGFIEDTPCINYGPCGIFAYLFFHEWISNIDLPIHLCFVMMKDYSECYHICIVLPNGEFFDGGIGIHTRDLYKEYILEDMFTYDHQRLEKWSYGLDRTFPRYCPSFDREKTRKIIEKHICKLRESLADLDSSCCF